MGRQQPRAGGRFKRHDHAVDVLGGRLGTLVLTAAAVPSRCVPNDGLATYTFPGLSPAATFARSYHLRSTSGGAAVHRHCGPIEPDCDQ